MEWLSLMGEVLFGAFVGVCLAQYAAREARRAEQAQQQQREDVG